MTDFPHKEHLPAKEGSPTGVTGRLLQAKARTGIRSPHFWVITALFIVFSYIYYGVLTAFHDVYVIIFFYPLIYAAIIYRVRGVVISGLVFLGILLPQALLFAQGMLSLMRTLIFALFAFLVSGLWATLLNYLEHQVEAYQEILSLNDELNSYIERLQKTQQQLIQAAKFSSIGQLAAAVAHELNNPLAGVLVYTKLLKDKLAKDSFDKEQVQKSLGKIESAIDYCTGIIRGLLDFARQSEPLLRPVTISRAIDKAMSLVGHQAKMKSIEIVGEGEKVVTTTAEDTGRSEEEILGQISGKEIASMMAENRVFRPSKEFSESAALKSLDEYKALYNWSIKDPEGFWGQVANQLDWYKKWDKFLEYNFKDKPEVRYFIGGKINVSYNCLDRHLNTWRKNKAAIIWQGEPDGDTKVYTYQQLYHEVCKFANVLKKLGAKKGDTVSVYLPMIPELAIAMLACVRIGAVHSVVFGGFSADALRDRILDGRSKILITADGYWRSSKQIGSKGNADTALKSCPDVSNVVVVKRLGLDIPMQAGRDHWWHELMNAGDITDDCEPEQMDADAPLFILYTSGSTGKPKGVVHTQAGYLLHCYQSMKWIFDIKEEDTYWCTADVGWVTGHSYIVYGPLSIGAASLMFESVPTYPGPDRFWQIVEKFGVNVFYTAPTVIRALMREGEDWPNKHDLSSLRLLGSVGEPINPEAWMWYHRVIGKEKCPIVDTWWQTETGGILITPLPGAIPTKPGSATLPFPGVEPVILKENGKEAGINEGGWLCIKKPWPGMMRTIFRDPERFKETYFSKFPGYYNTGDGARKDQDGYYWLMGRIDDVINVSGHRIGTAEVESSLVSHTKVAEAAVVGMPHSLKGQGIYAYVTLKTGQTPSPELEKELKTHVRQQIGPIATPDVIQFADGLPKTRSGKIMRRILVKIAAGNTENLGDTSTLADPSVVNTLLAGRKK